MTTSIQLSTCGFPGKVRSGSAVISGWMVVLIIGFCGILPAQQGNPEVAELRAALKFTQEKLADTEARLTQSEEQRKAAVEALTQAVNMAESKVLKANQIQEAASAFGVDLLSAPDDSMEQRLLKAVRDLDILRQENERKRKAIHDLSESFLKYLASTPDADAGSRQESHDAIAGAGKAIERMVDSGQLRANNLDRSKVISVDSKVGLVVVDAGRSGGVRVGTPVTVQRDDRPIYTAMIVNVRENISGALLQDQMGSIREVRIGDRVRPLATQTNF